MQSIALNLPTCDTQAKSYFCVQHHFILFSSDEPFSLIDTFLPGVKVQQGCPFQPLCACKIELKSCNVKLIFTNYTSTLKSSAV